MCGKKISNINEKLVVNDINNEEKWKIINNEEEEVVNNEK